MLNFWQKLLVQTQKHLNRNNKFLEQNIVRTSLSFCCYREIRKNLKLSKIAAPVRLWRKALKFIFLGGTIYRPAGAKKVLTISRIQYFRIKKQRPAFVFLCVKFSTGRCCLKIFFIVLQSSKVLFFAEFKARA